MKLARVFIVCAAMIAGAGTVLPARATPLDLPGFEVDVTVTGSSTTCFNGACTDSETGTFTLVNRTHDYLITEFTVFAPNPPAFATDASTTRTNWDAVYSNPNFCVTIDTCGSLAEFDYFSNGVSSADGNYLGLGQDDSFNWAADISLLSDPLITFFAVSPNGTPVTCAADLSSLGNGASAGCDPPAIPEPTSLSLFGAALALIGTMRARKANSWAVKTSHR